MYTVHVGKKVILFLRCPYVRTDSLFTLNQRKFRDTRMHMYINMQPVITVRKDAVQVREL